MLGFYSAKPFLIKNPTEILDDIGNNLIRRLFITSFFFFNREKLENPKCPEIRDFGGEV